MFYCGGGSMSKVKSDGKNKIPAIYSVKANSPIFDFGMTKGTVAGCDKYENKETKQAINNVINLLKTSGRKNK